jgi:hypothetical protein
MKGGGQFPWAVPRELDAVSTMVDQKKLIHLTSDDLRIIPPGQRLVVNVEEHIVTLFWPATEKILAQGHFPPSAFRTLVVLLKSPRGASYAELLAGLHCTEEVLKQLLAARTSDDVPEFQALASHWQDHLVEATSRLEKDPEAWEREVKPVRWAVKEKRGVQAIARKNGFGWRVRGLSRKGYVLLRAPAPASEQAEAHVSLTASRTAPR